MSGDARLVWLLSLILLLVAGPASAAASPSEMILLVVDERAIALATRVAAELEALGFSVQSQMHEPRPAELAAEARSAGAFAAIGIGPTAEGSVEITVLDRVTGKMLRRELLGRSLTDPTTRELVALRASELLRASLMEIEAPHPPRGDLPPAPVVKRVAIAPETIRRPERRLRLGAETGVLVVPGLWPTPLLQATVGWRLFERLEVAATLGSQLTASRRAFAAGRIEATARWFGLGPKLWLLPRSERSNVALGIQTELTLLALSASGFAADATYRGQSHVVWAPAGTVGIDSKIRLHKQLWLAITPALGVAFSQLLLRVDGQNVKTWGRPWLQCSTGVEVEL